MSKRSEENREARTIALVGGTGDQGPPLAVRWILAGNRALIGSRNLEKAKTVAEELQSILGSLGCDAEVGFGINEQVVTQADTVVMTIPYAGLESTIQNLEGKIKPGTLIISPIVPIEFIGKDIRLIHVEGASAAETIARGFPETRVVSALQTVSSKLLGDYTKPVKGDVMVCSDDPEAKIAAKSLVEQIPNLRAVDAGELANSHIVEEFTVLLIKTGRINKKGNLCVRLI